MARNALTEALGYVQRLKDRAGGLASNIVSGIQLGPKYFTPEGATKFASPVAQPGRSIWKDIPQVSPKFNSPMLGDVAANFMPVRGNARFPGANVAYDIAGNIARETLNAPQNLVAGGIRMQNPLATPQQKLQAAGQFGNAALNLLPFGKAGRLLEVGSYLKNAGVAKSAIGGAVGTGLYGGVQSALRGVSEGNNDVVGNFKAGFVPGAVIGAPLGAIGSKLAQHYILEAKDVIPDIAKLNPTWPAERVRQVAERWVKSQNGKFAGSIKKVPVFASDDAIGLPAAQAKALRIKYGLDLPPPGMTVKSLSKEEGEALRKLSPQGVGGGGVTNFQKKVGEMFKAPTVEEQAINKAKEIERLNFLIKAGEKYKPLTENQARNNAISLARYKERLTELSTPPPLNQGVNKTPTMTGAVGPEAKVLQSTGGETAQSIQPELPQAGARLLPSPKSPQQLLPAVSQTGSGNLPPSSQSISDQDLVSRLTAALKKAEPLRGTQEELYTKARGEKLARVMSARERVAGEKGYFAELGALKGELPKVQYQAIRQEFNQESVDRLFDMVRQNRTLDDWDKINAEVGLAKILGEKGGGVPTKGEIEKLYEVFGKEFTEALLSKRPFMEKLGDLALQAYNLPRSFMAGIGDLSGTLMQNALFAYRHPIMTAKNFGKQLQFFASENAFKLSQEEIASRPSHELMRKAKLSLTDAGPLVTKREEAFMASMAEKIPGIGNLVRASGRAYTGFLNRMRADAFDSLLQTQRQLGGDVNDMRFLKNAGEFVNAATGRGNLGQLERVAPVLGQGLFSARKLVATFQTLNPMFYRNAHPVVRREALLTMLSFFGGATVVTQLSKLAGAEVIDDPTNSDFGKIKFGNTRFNMYGPYQQLAVLFARLWRGYITSSVTGKKLMLGDESNPYAPSRLDIITRYFESKEHPTLSLILGALRGQDNLGRPFNAPTEVLNRFIPMILSDSYDLYKEHGPTGLLGSIPAILGIPAQTYGRSIPNLETTKTGRATIKTNPVPGLGEDIVNKITNKPLSNLPKEKWDYYTQNKGAFSEKQTELIKQKGLGVIDTIVEQRKIRARMDAQRTAIKIKGTFSSIPPQNREAYMKELGEKGFLTPEVVEFLGSK